MKKLLLIALLSANFLFAQVYVSEKAHITFFSKASIEDISADSKTCQSAIEVKKREVAFKMNIRSFSFPNKTMEEHFNENYLHSSKFPTATFEGKIIEYVNLTKYGVYDVTVTGKLNIHGKEKPRTIKGKVTVAKGIVTLDANFKIPLVDHDIEIPKMMFSKIAEVIDVTVHSENSLKK